jgi:hypothetical protein
MRRVICLTFSAMLVATMPVGAQDKPFSMIGTWIGKGEAISVGESLHPEHSNREAEPKVLPITLRLEVDKQTDTTFSGKSIGPSGTTERLVGSITKDRRRGIAVNPRGGAHQFVVVDANTLEGCYAIRHDAKFYATTCMTWVRQ